MAIRQGNLRAFEEELDRNADFFMERGVYLLLERAKIIAYRNLLHRVSVASFFFLCCVCWGYIFALLLICMDCVEFAGSSSFGVCFCVMKFSLKAL